MLTVNIWRQKELNIQLETLIPESILSDLGDFVFTLCALEDETDKLLGFLVYSNHPSNLNRAVLNYIYVHEDYRNMDVGSRLVKEMMDDLEGTELKAIEVNLLDSLGHFEDALNFFFDTGFQLETEERALITYPRQDIIGNKLLKESIDKFESVSDLKGARLYSDNDSRENFKLELQMGYTNAHTGKFDGDLSFSIVDNSEIIALAVGTVNDDGLLYYVYDMPSEKINRNNLGRLLIATGLAVKSANSINDITFTVRDIDIFTSLQKVFGEPEDFICSQRLVYKKEDKNGRI